jgi:hypothetical protein
MPERTTSSRTALSRLILFAALGWALVTLGRGRGFATDASRTRTRRGGKRRLAASLAFATLFFAGASLSALAGDEVVQALEPGDSTAETTTTEATPDEAPPEEATTPEEAPATDEAPADDGTNGAAGDEATADDGTAAAEGGNSEAPAADGGTAPAAPGTPESATSPEAAGSGSTGDASTSTSTTTTGGTNGSSHPSAPAEDSAPPVVAPLPNHVEASRDAQPETDDGMAATVWLHRTLPDPTPPAKRLAPGFARQLKAVAKDAQVSWSDILAVVRADGFTGHRPATKKQLRSIARQIAANDEGGEWQAFLAIRGRTAWADRAQALARYNRAVGLHALVVGFDAAKSDLVARVLTDHRIDIYPGGDEDIRSGRIDVRVLVLLRYLAESHGQVTVSCLKSGHRLYARPGHISAHIYGLAADISALEGVSIYGHQEPGGVTERAVRNILLLPAELRPQQVISLLGMGGPSFPLANHDDHIHVGY